jgi:hypothetical protein
MGRRVEYFPNLSETGQSSGRGAVSARQTRSSKGGPTITVVTGVGGRLESASATIRPEHIGKGTDTTQAARDRARAMGNANDDAGHAIGNNLGGPGGGTSDNIFPFNPTVNRGEFSQFEQDVADEVRAGKDVQVTVEPQYQGDATRPHEVVYTVVVDGESTSRTFQNPP